MVDVESIIATAAGEPAANALPAGDAASAKPQLIGSEAQIVVTTTARTVGEKLRGAEPAVLTVIAGAGDCVRIYAISGSNNFEGAALLAGMHPRDGDDVLGGFALVALEQPSVMPADAPLTLADDSSIEEFWFWEAPIVADGTQSCTALLALYGRDDHGQPSFAGLYRWDFSLTVKLTEPSEEPNEGGAS
ncbi:MAG: hypothetical protein JSR61_02335 [Proteobacteria bacterium]|nr:hypothetical protein [Pseudomonadota bacterium]